MTSSIEVGAVYRRLFVAAVVTALASTVGVWFYYRAARVGDYTNVSALLVWFAATLLIPVTFAWAGYWLAVRLTDNPRRAFLWALGLMVAVTLIMLLAEWMVTWPDRPVPRPASVKPLTSLRPLGSVNDRSR
jgi:hypothetical protein